MNKITFTMKNLAKSIALASIFCFSALGNSQEDTFVPKIHYPTTPACVLYAKDYEGRNSNLRSQEVIDRMEANMTPCSTINVNYNGFTPEAEAAFQFAVDIWAMSIESSQPITVSANFEPLNPGVLGQAGPTSVRTVSSPDGLPNVFYAQALAEKLDDIQINPDPFGNSVDITASFSSTFNWYYGTDANPPGGQFDFVSVVLHEIGHGLGLISFANTDGFTGRVREPNNAIPTAYDINMQNGAGQSLLDTAIFTDPSNAMHGQLTSNNIFNNSPIAVAQNNGVIPKTFAPNPWDGGSSYSHWDEATFPQGNINALMTPQIGPGAAEHNPGPITLGLFEDMGWSICGGSLSVENFSIKTVDVSPNPFTSSITIQLSVDLDNNYTVNVLDINGRTVISETKAATNGTFTISNLETLDNALYFVKITNNTSNASITKKIIKN